MVAWSGVNGVDFWGEVNPAPHGEIVHQRFESLRGKDPVEITAIQHWISRGKLLMVERRTLQAPAPLSEGTWLEWSSEFSAPKEPVTLSAAPTKRFSARQEGKYRLLTRAAQQAFPSRDWAPSGQGAERFPSAPRDINGRV